MKKVQISKVLPAIARKIGQQSANQACVWWYAQPKVPEGLKKSK